MSEPWGCPKAAASDGRSWEYCKGWREGQKKLFDLFYDHVDAYDSSPKYVDICIPMDNWRALCEAFGKNPKVEP